MELHRILPIHFKDDRTLVGDDLGRREPDLATGKELSQMLLDEYNGKVPSNYEGLVRLPGVGRKTAGCVLVYAFRKPAIPVDTHVHRVSNRLGWVKTKSPLKTEEELLKVVPRKYWFMVNEAFVIHGQTTCKPITPLCSKCPVEKYCKKAGVKKSK